MPDGIQRSFFPEDPDLLAAAGRRFNKTKDVVGSFGVGGDRSSFPLSTREKEDERETTTNNNADRQSRIGAREREALAWLAARGFSGIGQLVQDVGLDRVVYEVVEIQALLREPDHGIRQPMGLFRVRCYGEDRRQYLTPEPQPAAKPDAAETFEFENFRRRTGT